MRFPTISLHENGNSISKWSSEATSTRVHPHVEPNSHNPTSNLKCTNTIPHDDSSSTNQMFVNKLVLSEMSLPEINNAISELKCGKSAGTDKITNEVLKCLPPSWVSCPAGNINTILCSTEYPPNGQRALSGQFSKKENCESYCGISLISCKGKLFTSILCNRCMGSLNKTIFVLPHPSQKPDIQQEEIA